MVDGLTACAARVRQAAGGRDRLLIGVDGPDAAGKTTFADALADAVTGDAGPFVLRASIDGFHRPRTERLRRGPLSPEGCYHNTFDLDELRSALLEPFARRADAVRVTAFNHAADRRVDAVPVPVPPHAVLILDGVFLQRPELRPLWDLVCYLDVPPEVTLRRAVVRDVSVFGSAAAVRERYERRYLPAQELYRAVASPLERADLVLDMRDPVHPLMVRDGATTV